MIKISKFILLCLLILNGYFVSGQGQIDGLSVSVETLKKHVYTLASDSLQGRRTGTFWQRKAAIYCAQTFKNLHLWPIFQKDSGYSFFQPFYFGKVNVFGNSLFQT